MPFRRGGFSRRNRALSLRPVDSMKNVSYTESPTGTTVQNIILVNTVDNPLTSSVVDVQRGCNIKAIWLSIDVCGLAGTGVLQTTRFYLMKNPGNNLTPPAPGTEGTSNEKKFIFKTWSPMTMRNQDGNTPYHWEGWIKIPKRYQRFGTADLLQLVHIVTTAAGHLSLNVLYKWYR